METRVRVAVWAVWAASAAGCASSPGATSLDEVALWWCGSFSNRQQAELFPQDFEELELTVRELWPGRTDGPWLHLEERKKGRAHVREQIYRLRSMDEVGGSRVRVDVFTKPAGTASLQELRPERLEPLPGCAMELLEQQSAWVGGTRGRACANSSGAAYTTTLMRLFENRFETWYRGFDARGEQVFGPTAGAYVFEKVTGRAPADS
ncbi:MAG: chromophore lyase CpcT/CpeT [Planctomycetes bacterium]|nr:chromophore lyase CpcT/CpeT [Planctomycetota bacterium]